MESTVLPVPIGSVGKSQSLLMCGIFIRTTYRPSSHLGDFIRRGSQGFWPKLAYFYLDSPEACAKILANFYPDMPQGVKGIIGGPPIALGRQPPKNANNGKKINIPP
jgi:hypothetical protein